MTQPKRTPLRSFKLLDLGAKIFIGIVVSLGLVVIGLSAHSVYSVRLNSQWFFLAALTFLSGSITVKLPSIPATISVSETFVFTSVLLFGTAAGTITVTLDGFIFRSGSEKRGWSSTSSFSIQPRPRLSIWWSQNVIFRNRYPTTRRASGRSVCSISWVVGFRDRVFLIKQLVDGDQSAWRRH